MLCEHTLAFAYLRIPSQMSSAQSVGGAVAPKRERGRLRVEAILGAAADVISAKGYAAATMTEIAARSHTAIGSLYRFFPTKDVLADALSQRFLADIGARFDAVEARAGALSPPALADAMLDLMIEMRCSKTAVLALMEVLGEADARRGAVRERVADGIAAVLRAASPRLGDERRGAATAVVMHLLRGVSRLSEDADTAGSRLSELRLTLALYLADVLA